MQPRADKVGGRRRSGGAFSVSYAALDPCLDGNMGANGTAQQGQGASELPPVQVIAPETKRHANRTPAQRADRADNGAAQAARQS